MPSICRFNGIVIYMYYNDHVPPHFHARYQGQVVEVAIQPVAVLQGTLPTPQLTAVLSWAQRRQADLMADWMLARAQHPLQSIAP